MDLNSSPTASRLRLISEDLLSSAVSQPQPVLNPTTLGFARRLNNNFLLPPHVTLNTETQHGANLLDNFSEMPPPMTTRSSSIPLSPLVRTFTMQDVRPNRLLSGLFQNPPVRLQDQNIEAPPLQDEDHVGAESISSLSLTR